MQDSSGRHIGRDSAEFIKNDADGQPGLFQHGATVQGCDLPARGMNSIDCAKHIFGFISA